MQEGWRVTRVRLVLYKRVEVRIVIPACYLLGPSAKCPPTSQTGNDLSFVAAVPLRFMHLFRVLQRIRALPRTISGGSAFRLRRRELAAL